MNHCLNQTKAPGRPAKRVELRPGDKEMIGRLLATASSSIAIRLKMLLLASEGRFSIRILETKVKLSASRVQIWLDRYEEDGLDAIFRDRRCSPRGQLRDLDNLLWLIAGIESKRVTNTRSGRRWLAAKGCILNAQVVRRWLKQWLRTTDGKKRLRRMLWFFMRSAGYISSLAPLDSADVSDAHEKLVRYLKEARKTKD